MAELQGLFQIVFDDPTLSIVTTEVAGSAGEGTDRALQGLVQDTFTGSAIRVIYV